MDRRTRHHPQRRPTPAHLRIPRWFSLGFLSRCPRRKKIPTTRERIEAGFESYLRLYNFTPEQGDTLGKIKDAFVANLSSQGRVDIDAIFANPIYARLIGSFEEINQRFDGRLKEIVDEMQKAFKAAA